MVFENGSSRYADAEGAGIGRRYCVGSGAMDMLWLERATDEKSW